MNRWQSTLYWLSALTIIIIGFGGMTLVMMEYLRFWYEYLFLALINTAPLQVWLAARWQQWRLLNGGLLCQVLQAIAICLTLFYLEEFVIPAWIAAIFLLTVILIYSLIRRQIRYVLLTIAGLCWCLLNEQEVLALRTWLAGIFISLFLLGLSCRQHRKQLRLGTV